MADAFDVVVAGGGIAGLTAGLTAARLGRSTLVLTGGVPGGLLLSIETIDGIPGFADGVAGYELCPVTQEQAADAGAEPRAPSSSRSSRRASSGGSRRPRATGSRAASSSPPAPGSRSSASPARSGSTARA